MPDNKLLPVWGNVPDTFAAELTAVEALGPCVRLVFTVPVQDGAEARRDRIACIVMPATALPSMVQHLAFKPRPITKDQQDAALDADELPVRLH